MATDAFASAREAGLRYVDSAEPGIRRKVHGRGFVYLAADGDRITDRSEIRRFRRLAIPPAWTDVWICRDPRGHIQATGRDARGRKQYRYHERWGAVRNDDKYSRLVAFACALPAIRRRAARDLAAPGLSRDKVLACVVRLLESGLIRIGNEEYARANRSFGLTTLRSRHATVRGDLVTFRFRGKSGKEHEVRVVDERLARVVRRCQELPGQELFEYVDGTGDVRSIGSQDVNERLREVAGVDVSAKDFRTWVGTVLMARELSRAPHRIPGTRGIKKDVLAAVKRVAAQLGNTPAVCRRSYIHPAIIESFEQGRLRAAMRATRTRRRGLSADECGVLAILGRARPTRSDVAA